MLKKIREKPHHIKQSISLFLTIVIFSVILFVWVSSWDARARDKEVRDKTVSPVAGMASMFDGLTSGLKDRLSGTPSFAEPSAPAAATTTANSFDLSGVVILDGSKSSGR